jgi:hypothetical protein
LLTVTKGRFLANSVDDFGVVGLRTQTELGYLTWQHRHQKLQVYYSCANIQ